MTVKWISPSIGYIPLWHMALTHNAQEYQQCDERSSHADVWSFCGIYSEVINWTPSGCPARWVQDRVFHSPFPACSPAGINGDPIQLRTDPTTGNLVKVEDAVTTPVGGTAQWSYAITTPIGIFRHNSGILFKTFQWQSDNWNDTWHSPNPTRSNDSVTSEIIFGEATPTILTTTQGSISGIDDRKWLTSTTDPDWGPFTFLGSDYEMSELSDYRRHKVEYRSAQGIDPCRGRRLVLELTLKLLVTIDWRMAETWVPGQKTIYRNKSCLLDRNLQGPITTTSALPTAYPIVLPPAGIMDIPTSPKKYHYSINHEGNPWDRGFIPTWGNASWYSARSQAFTETNAHIYAWRLSDAELYFADDPYTDDWEELFVTDDTEAEEPYELQFTDTITWKIDADNYRDEPDALLVQDDQAGDPVWFPTARDVNLNDPEYFQPSQIIGNQERNCDDTEELRTMIFYAPIHYSCTGYTTGSQPPQYNNIFGYAAIIGRSLNYQFI